MGRIVKTGALIIVIVMTVLVWQFAVMYTHIQKPLVDEPTYANRIYQILQGEQFFDRAIPASPAYMLIIAGMVYLEGKIHAVLPWFPVIDGQSISLLRANSLILSFACVILFFLVANAVVIPGSSALRILQFLFFPILFPFFPLVYTDVTSLLFILIAIALMAKKHYHWAGLAACIAVVIRQTAIVWLVFLALLVLISVYENLPASSSWAQSGQRQPWRFYVQKIRSHWESFLRPISTYVLGCIACIVFVFLNGSVALGDAAKHPFPYFGTGNIFYFLFLAFFLFLPLCIRRARDVLLLCRQGRVQVFLIILFLVYWLTFHVSHPYNLAPVVQEFWRNFDTMTFLRTGHVPNIGGHSSYYLRNNILVYFDTNSIRKLFFFLPAAYAAVFLISTPLQKSIYRLLYVFTILVLLPSWLIETRYSFVPFTLFLLWRVQESRKMEILLLLYWVGGSLFLFHGIAANNFFL